jgi:hypothetical protein
MSGFWIPVLVLILNSANPQLLYDSTVVYDSERECLREARDRTSAIPEEVLDEANSLHFACFYIPDIRGI